MLEFRDLQEEDIDQMVEIEKLCFATPWTKEAFLAEKRENKKARYVIARIDNRVAGYGGAWVVLDEAQVTNIAVHPDFRRQGIADTIVRKLKNVCADAGAQVMFLEVRPSNKAAQELYFKHGFAPVGIRKNYYYDNGENALVMKCDALKDGES